MGILIRIIITASALMITAHIVPGIVVTNIYVALLAGLILGVLNAVVRPLLILLTLPVTILTLGLFIFVINATIFILTASIVEGFAVSGFIPALVGSFVVALISTVANKLID